MYVFVALFFRKYSCTAPKSLQDRALWLIVKVQVNFHLCTEKNLQLLPHWLTHLSHFCILYCPCCHIETSERKGCQTVLCCKSKACHLAEMSSQSPLVNVEKWIAENQNAFLPPVCNKLMWVPCFGVVFLIWKICHTESDFMWKLTQDLLDNVFGDAVMTRLPLIPVFFSGTFPSCLSCLLEVLTPGRIIT